MALTTLSFACVPLAKAQGADIVVVKGTDGNHHHNVGCWMGDAPGGRNAFYYGPTNAFYYTAP